MHTTGRPQVDLKGSLKDLLEGNEDVVYQCISRLLTGNNELIYLEAVECVRKRGIPVAHELVVGP